VNLSSSTRLRISGTCVVAVAVATARALHVAYRAPDRAPGESILDYLILALLIALALVVLGQPQANGEMAPSLLGALSASLTALSIGAVVLLVAPESVPRFVVIAASTLIFGLLVVVTWLANLFIRRRGLIDRVVAIVDAHERASLIADSDTKLGREQPFTLVSCVDPSGDWQDVLATHSPTLVVLGEHTSSDERSLQRLEPVHANGVRIRTLDDFYDEWLGRLPVASIDRIALLSDVESVHGGYAPVKRTIDITFAVVGSIVLLIGLPFILLGNLLGNRGQLFFRQERVGQNGVPFEILKLRTMIVGAEDISGWTSNNDARITPFGRFLRRTHVDELPQVYNVLVGQLSLVGPRPEQVRYVRELEQQLPHYGTRHIVRPGLTGWAQVKYRYAASTEDARIKLQYDLHYLRHESLTTDLRIMWLTIRHLVRGGGR
jgi:lipopolysaccharide/colanic/teichoic acid biosynthesis glycosyltransferase